MSGSVCSRRRNSVRAVEFQADVITRDRALEVLGVLGVLGKVHGGRAPVPSLISYFELTCAPWLVLLRLFLLCRRPYEWVHEGRRRRILSGRLELPMAYCVFDLGEAKRLGNDSASRSACDSGPARAPRRSCAAAAGRVWAHP